VSSSGLIALFTNLRPALLRFLVSRGASADEAEDILQDLNLKLLADDLGPIGQPRAYLYRMANNQFLVHRRAVGRRVRREEDWVSAQRGDAHHEADEKPSAETELIAREQVAILQRVLDGLPERTRTIFRRFRIDGEPQRAIANQLGISVSAVEKHLARAYEVISEAKLRIDEGRPERRRLAGGMTRNAP